MDKYLGNAIKSIEDHEKIRDIIMKNKVNVNISQTILEERMYIRIDLSTQLPISESSISL